ncbi:MAG: hypothetical protein V5A57_01890 [Candidatus Paceibacterota bacterium]
MPNSRNKSILFILLALVAVMAAGTWVVMQQKAPEPSNQQANATEAQEGLSFTEDVRTFRVSGGEGTPTFNEIKVEPYEAEKGEQQKVQVKLNSEHSIKQLKGEINCGDQQQTYSLSRFERDDSSHPAQEVWQKEVKISNKLPVGQCKTIFKVTDQEENKDEITFFWEVKGKQSRVKNFFTGFFINTARAASCNFPSRGGCKMEDSQLINDPVSGVAGGDVEIEEGNTLQLGEGVTFVWNPGHSVYPMDYIIFGEGASLKKGYMCVEDKDGDGCWLGSPEYSKDQNCQSGYRTLSSISSPHQGDCDDEYSQYCTNCPGDACDSDSECPSDGDCTYENQCDEEKNYINRYCENPESEYSQCVEETATCETRDTDGVRCQEEDSWSSCDATYDSTCDESATGLRYKDYKTCSGGSCSDTHTESESCTISRNTDGDNCGTNSCSQTYDDYCDGETLVDYDGDGTKDSYSVSDSCTRTCSNGSCDSCSVDCSVSPTEHKVDGVCGYSTCDDVCNEGDTRCSGNTVQECRDTDSDPCTDEWEDDKNCGSNYCDTGGDRYDYCRNGDVWGIYDERERGCSGGSCYYDWDYNSCGAEKVRDCSCGCTSGSCDDCGSTGGGLDIDLPDCPFNGSDGVYVQNINCDWPYKAKLGEGFYSNCGIPVAWSYELHVDQFSPTSANALGVKAGIAPVNEKEEYCKIGNSAGNYTCPSEVRGDVGTLWVKDEESSWSEAYDAGCRLGGSCKYEGAWNEAHKGIATGYDWTNCWDALGVMEPCRICIVK